MHFARVRTIPHTAPTGDARAPGTGDARGPVIAALVIAALLTAVWSWWALRDGAWFGVVFLPGAILLSVGLLIVTVGAPWLGRLRERPTAAIACGGLFALAAWTAVSALWTPSPDVAIADAQRVLLYAVAFCLGMWVTTLVGARAQLPLVPLACAGAVAGTVTAVGLLTTEEPSTYLAQEATLDHPIGYHNANAAFFFLAVLAAAGLAAAREVDWRLRALALATATLCAGLALLSQSRGSVPAAAIAVAVYVVLSPLKLRTLCWLILALAPAVAVVPALTDLHRAVNDVGVGASADELHRAGLAVGGTAALSLVMGGFAARFERVIPGLGSTSPRSNAGILGALAVAAMAALVALVGAVGNPIDWATSQVDRVRLESPNLAGETTRFNFDLDTERYDFWRVALEDARERPLRGAGAGGFQYSYLEERETGISPRDAHSAPLEILGELGVPGLTMWLLAVVAAIWAALRARRGGVETAALSAVALAVATYWLVHSSIDWFWTYPAITAPVLALLGCASGAWVRRSTPRPPGVGRGVVGAVAVVLALSAVPPYLSERYVDAAYAGWRADLVRAYQDLERARALNPLDDTPLLAEGAIADAAGDRRRAIAAYREATEERPEQWAAHYLLSELLADQRPAEARRVLRQARRLNPLSPEIDELETRLRNRGEVRKEAG